MAWRSGGSNNDEMVDNLKSELTHADEACVDTVLGHHTLVFSTDLVLEIRCELLAA